MLYISFLIIYYVSRNSAAQIDESCTDKTKCEYQCHCDRTCLDYSGLCQPPDKCRNGWFGLMCQYKDLMNLDGVILTGSPRHQLHYLNDNNGKTCVTHVMSVTVTWKRDYHLTWTRLVFKNILPMIKISMLYITQQAKTYVLCKQQRLYIVDTRTLDIRCLDNVTTSSVKIEGNLSDLCSMYISGGRNFAYKQEAKLSTTYGEYGGDRAVDGKTNSYFESNSCAHSDIYEDSPKLTVTLKQPVLIHRVVLYNRDKLQNRLRSFYLEIFNSTQQKTFEYEDRSTVGQAVYEVNVNNSLAKQVVVSVKHKSPYHNDEKPILTICEMEVYGECPPGKWGLTCINSCPEHCARSCHIDDGSCNVSCVGSNDPPECATECIKGKWGVNCQQNCSNCFNISCDRHTGMCDDGCLGFSDPPVCNKSCISNFFGRNCSEQCPVNCLNKTCRPASGHCYLCIDGYQGKVCSDPCRDGLWGTNCSRNCNNFCHNGLCNFKTGECIGGCKDGYLPPQCNAVCLHGTYGRNCSQNCSLRCLNASCHHVTGNCGGCGKKMYGDFCESEFLPESNTSITGVIVSVLLVALLLLLAAFIIYFRINKLPTLNDIFSKWKQRRPYEHDEQKEDNYFEDNEAMDSSTDDDSETSISFSDSDKTNITVGDLHLFLKSKAKEYFNQQFKKIPAAEGVTTEVGLSEENRYKNRYKDIVTYDHSRVQLQVNEEEKEEDYINASYIKGFSEDVRFIASQGPNRVMVNDFIRMLWEQKIDKVVMLTNLVENNKIKCEKYWPEKGKSQFGQIKVNVISTHTFSDYVIRTLELIKRNAPRHLLKQYHFTSWPDKDVPDTPWSLVDFYFKIFSTPTVKPIVVHCSAGVGRTGTFIALCNIVDQARETGRVNFFDSLTKLRQDRVCMIQNADQYQFLHTSAQVALMCMESIITKDDIGEKLNELNKKTFIGSCIMEEEYKVLCDVCQNIEDCERVKNEEFQFDLEIYQNAVCMTKIVRDRFPELAPKEKYRVHLDDESSTGDGYIHAVNVQGYIGTYSNILTQLPMPVTVVDFWRCVFNNNISLIVAFEVDSYLSDKTVAQYLPCESEQVFTCPPFKIQSSSFKSTHSWEERKLNVYWKSNVHRLVHLKCNVTDTDSRKLFTIVKQIRTYETHGKALYMCKNGATLCGIAYILTVLLERLDNDLYVSVPFVVGAVKTVRPQVISTLVEYRSLYEVLERHVETSSVYNNMADINLGSNFKDTKLRPSHDIRVNEDQSVYANY
ncbi:Receptor-type tyrosine-protein phosphatase zeta [Bulinus truncatus]|nr:Receptor-type tyrosine-protein phosphatase zeta [Bulinus truncatus]